MGRVYSLMGSNAKAKAAYEKAIQISPEVRSTLDTPDGQFGK
jgi:cytochrome c-type biogenesis protein CcmH/NrfG